MPKYVMVLTLRLGGHALCGKSAYPPRFSVIADIPALTLSAITGCEQVQQTAVIQSPPSPPLHLLRYPLQYRFPLFLLRADEGDGLCRR